ncbi:DUF1304 domain-containing protein [Algoriphagus vanfongensis]|uniref:DUF1304 domain-containing protein n=1 Tax=Algoriphagus vanfongensis TaxID=426371 RepID=UPI0003F6CC0D|nr:DUF1304 domain-containing protein [Algoriphagus vanfongensis]
MDLVIKVIVALVALQHIFFLWFEMFAWETMGARLFRGNSPEYYKKTKAMAANQGLYNGFLAAGLIWSLLYPDSGVASQLSLFFLGCVLVAGLYGAYSVSRKILFIQGVPALIGILLILVANH